LKARSPTVGLPGIFRLIKKYSFAARKIFFACEMLNAILGSEPAR
jgi:hypothetical protein